MFTRWGKLARAECEHPRTVIVHNAGIERTVCESCGHVSFTRLDGLAGSADRRQFEREVDRPERTADTDL